MSAARILLFDIETAPSLGHYFERYKEGNIIECERDWFMLSFAYKWLGVKGITTHALPDFPGYKHNKECDKRLVGELWALLDMADIVVGHNAKRFDVRRSNARFVFHGLKPPSPYKVTDTLLVARRFFQFESNRLDDLAGYLGIGRKANTFGRATWLGCVRGDPAHWKIMRQYNAHDVDLLEQVYLRLRAWDTGHPNLTHYTRADACPVCQSNKIVRHGWAYVASGKKQRETCRACGHRFVVGKIIKEAA